MPHSQRLSLFLKKVVSMSRRHDGRHDDVETPGRSVRRLSSWNSSLSRGSSSQRSTGSSSCRSVESNSSGANYDSEDDCRSSPPRDVPAGCLPVYVGMDRSRFVIPTAYLSNRLFRALLAKSEVEYGLRCEGGLRIACSPDVFEYFLRWLRGETADSWEEMERSFSRRSARVDLSKLHR